MASRMASMLFPVGVVSASDFNFGGGLPGNLSF
jgi:hypothetical protein